MLARHCLHGFDLDPDLDRDVGEVVRVEQLVKASGEADRIGELLGETGIDGERLIPGLHRREQDHVLAWSRRLPVADIADAVAIRIRLRADLGGAIVERVRDALAVLIMVVEDARVVLRIRIEAEPATADERRAQP
ncbi:hypothetical protein BH11MYX1_BH11MYX1_04190 [soil metagenome]